MECLNKVIDLLFITWQFEKYKNKSSCFCRIFFNVSGITFNRPLICEQKDSFSEALENTILSRIGVVRALINRIFFISLQIILQFEISEIIDTKQLHIIFFFFSKIFQNELKPTLVTRTPAFFQNMLLFSNKMLCRHFLKASLHFDGQMLFFHVLQ